MVQEVEGKIMLDLDEAGDCSFVYGDTQTYTDADAKKFSIAGFTDGDIIVDAATIDLTKSIGGWGVLPQRTKPDEPGIFKYVLTPIFTKAKINGKLIKLIVGFEYSKDYDQYGVSYTVRRYCMDWSKDWYYGDNQRISNKEKEDIISFFGGEAVFSARECVEEIDLMLEKMII